MLECSSAHSSHRNPPHCEQKWVRRRCMARSSSLHCMHTGVGPFNPVPHPALPPIASCKTFASSSRLTVTKLVGRKSTPPCACVRVKELVMPITKWRKEICLGTHCRIRSRILVLSESLLVARSRPQLPDVWISPTGAIMRS